MFTSAPRLYWHYRYWQRQTVGYLRTFDKNKLPNNEMIGYVINDKHPKSIRVACDKYMWVMRYKKAFRYTKKVWAHDEHSECRLGDVVRVQPLGYRVGPWKTYVLVRILHREPRDEEIGQRTSEARNLLLSGRAEPDDPAPTIPSLRAAPADDSPSKPA
mmetsp:Transcript_44485/g.81237  ORF Transcript_44485/g.81237 Transcript_44485/m.81237 type:complete len:159 (+) Transcript_44485:68-544(+)